MADEPDSPATTRRELAEIARTAIYSSSGTNDGVGFAVPATTATAVAAQLIEAGTVSWPVLGIRGQDVDDTSIASMSELTAVIRSRKVGDTVTLTILRGGEQLCRDVVLSAA